MFFMTVLTMSTLTAGSTFPWSSRPEAGWISFEGTLLLSLFRLPFASAEFCDSCSAAGSVASVLDFVGRFVGLGVELATVPGSAVPLTRAGAASGAAVRRGAVVSKRAIR